MDHARLRHLNYQVYAARNPVYCGDRGAVNYGASLRYEWDGISSAKAFVGAATYWP